LVFLFQEDGEVIRERKMKEEEEEVDVDSMDIDVSPDASTTATTAGLSRRKSNSKTLSSLLNGSDVAGVGRDPSKSLLSCSNTNDRVQSNLNSDFVDATTTWDSNSKGKESSATTTASTMTPTPTLLMGCYPVRVGDEDSIWADEDPDEDVKRWKMNISHTVAGLSEEVGI